MNTTIRTHWIDAAGYLLAATALLAAAPPAAAAGNRLTDLVGALSMERGEPQQTERFSKTVPLGKARVVTVSNVSGDIVVTGGGGDQVVIEAVKQGRTIDAVKDVTIEVIATDERIEIATRYPNRMGERHNHGSVSYTVTVPRRAGVRVKTVSGDVRVSTVDGESRAESVSGDVRVLEAGQFEGASSVSGDVIVKSAGSTLGVTLSSVSGTLQVTDLKAPSLSGKSVSGDLDLRNVTTDKVSVSSVSGTVDFSGALSRGGRYALSSHSGDLVVVILNRSGYEIEASTFSGSVSADPSLGDGDERRGPGRRVRGTVGDGAASLELKTFSGDIRVGPAGAGAVKK